MATQTYLYESKRLSPEQVRAFVGAFVGWVFDYYEVTLLTFLIIPISRDLHLPASHAGYILSTQLVFLAIGGVLFGRLGDRYGRRSTLMWTIVVYAGGTFARAFSYSETWLLLWTAFTALGIGGEYAVGQALVSEVMPTQRRGWWSGLLYGGLYFGIGGGALVGGYLPPIIGWRWTFAISALPIIVAFYVRSAAPESDVWKVRRQTVRSSWHDLTKRAFLVPFFICFIASVCQFFGYYGITTFLPTYLVKQGFSLGKTGWWLFFTAFAGLIGCITASYTSDRWGRRVTLSYIAGTACVGGLLLFFTWPYLLTSSWILVPFFLYYFGTNAGTIFGSLFSEMFPTEVRTTGVAAPMMIARGLTFIPIMLAGWVFPRYGYAPIVLAGAAEFGFLAMWAWIFKETRGKSIHEIDKETEASPRAVEAAQKHFTPRA
jgi:putative MFS transporter